MILLSLDVGTEESGYCLIDIPTFKPINFGRINNNDLMKVVKNSHYDLATYEEFQSYGMPVGKTTLDSILWNGRFIQAIIDKSNGNIKPYPMTRTHVKHHLCNAVKAKDSNVRQALIDRFGEPGTKKKPGMLYGIKKDVWSAYAIGVTYIDTVLNKNEGIF